ncbi:MAG: hypothetical protein K2N90_13480 [Lachnospiraceae bacterium]|nr:hypothetical protein [Lachnospiraceae bacterium]
MLLIVPFVSGEKILIGHVSGTQLIYGISVVILLLAILFVILRYKYIKCVKNLIIMITGVIISTAALLGVSFFYLLFVADSETYYTFYSPDKNYSVVAEEWTWFLAGNVILYERTNPFLVEKKAVLITDDGFRAIEADAYEIQWKDNVVTFTIETTDWHRSKDTAVVALRMRK